MIIPKEETLEVYSEGRNGEIRVGIATIWRRSFEEDGAVMSIKIQLDFIPLDGQITIRSKALNYEQK